MELEKKEYNGRHTKKSNSNKEKKKKKKKKNNNNNTKHEHNNKKHNAQSWLPLEKAQNWFQLRGRVERMPKAAERTK